MDSNELKLRTKSFALQVIMMVRGVKKDLVSEIILRQLIRCSTSVAANYRAACRAKSRADFVNKISIVEEEADESLFWLELLSDVEIIDKQTIHPLANEANQLTAIFTKIRKTTKENGLK